MHTVARSTAATLALLAVVALTGPAAHSAAAARLQPAGWSPPTAIPGTAGQANPVASTAPDGSEVVLWAVPGSASPENTVRARLRSPGSTTWRRLPSPMVDKPYGGVIAVVPTVKGDFWATFTWFGQIGISEVYVSRLDAGTRQWTKPTRVFHDADYGHESPSLAISDNGTVFIAATAVPHTFTNPPQYRAEVATRSPGSRWRTTFLSPVNKHAYTMNLVANPKGQAAFSFIQGYDLSAMRVRAATRGAGAKATWNVADLSVAGDAQRAYTAIGADGTAAVEWNAPSTGAQTVRLATLANAGGDSWTVSDAVTGGGSNSATFPVVTPDGVVTALWETFNNPNSLLYARQLTGGSWGTATPYSQGGFRSVLQSAVVRPGGSVALLYHQFSNPGTVNEGLRLRVTDHGVLGSEVTVSDAGDGSANSVWLGVDAALGNHLVWTRGDYPDTDFVTMGDSAVEPVAMRSPYSGVQVRRAKVAGRMRVGHRATCRTGYWVGAATITYRWFRGASVIRHESRRQHLLVAADKSHTVSCRVKAASDSGVQRLSSSGRRVR